jgi:hypothetical protein
MMGIIKNILGTLLGFTAGSSIANKASGVVNYAIFLPLGGWVWFHKADAVILQMVVEYKGKMETFTLFQTTIGGLALVVAGVFVYVEFLRRSNSGVRVYPQIGPGP